MDDQKKGAKKPARSSPQVTFPPAMMAQLRQLVRTGHYGNNESEAIRILVHDAWRELIDSGRLARIQANVKEAAYEDSEDAEGPEEEAGEGQSPSP